MPRSVDIAAYKQIISDLPESDNVVLFGLPANIDRTLQSNSSQEIINQLLLLKNDDVRSQKFNKDQWSQQLLPFLQLWKKLNTSTDLSQIAVEIASTEDPIVTFFDLVKAILIRNSLMQSN